MRISTILFLIFSQISLFSQVKLRSVELTEPILKPGEYNLPHDEKMMLDSFYNYVTEYKILENKIINKLNDENIKRNIKTNMINGFVCSYIFDFEKNFNLLTQLTKKDFLLFSRNVNYKGEPKSYSCIGYGYFRSFFGDYLLQNKELYDCNFFNSLKYNNDERFKNIDQKHINQIKREDRLNNIFYIANLLKNNDLELRKVVADEYANHCFRENAKLILEALDKNK